MNLQTLQSRLNLESVQPDWQDKEITTGYTSDLLSDVIANADEGAVLITIQAHLNTIAVAVLAGVPAVILCNNRPVTDDMIEAAKREKIALFRSADDQFTVSWRLHQALDS